MLLVIITSIIMPIVSQSIACGRFTVVIKEKKFYFHNFLTVFCLFSFLNSLFYNYEINFLIIFATIFILSLVMHYVHEFRGTNLNLEDVLSINTAKEVAGGYKYSIKLVFVFFFIVFLLSVFCIIFLQNRSLLYYYGLPINNVDNRNVHIYRFILFEILHLFSFFVSFFILRDLVSGNLYDYSLNAGEKQGYLYNFISSIPFLHKNEYECDIEIKNTLNRINEENGIFVNNVNTICTQDFDRIPKIDNSNNKPNIITIMNESFGSAHYNIKTNYPVTPYFDSLNNVVKGNLYVNTFGGGTANTEFEFLTGMTIGNYPYPVMPYNNFVKSDKYSFVRHLKKLNYNTVAMHPYTATNYHRDKVYKRFGFDELRFYDDFRNKKYVRNFVSDESMYEEIIRKYEERNSDNIFIFGITMQNHSGYSKFNGARIKSQINRNTESLDSYLSLMNISDSAIKLLIDYFDKQDERTIILFFGDHNASFGTDLNRIVYNMKNDYEFSNAYKTPFFIYDNKNNLDGFIERISANFLFLELLKYAMIPNDELLNIVNDNYKLYSAYNYHRAFNRETGKIEIIPNDYLQKFEKEYLK